MEKIDRDRAWQKVLKQISKFSGCAIQSSNGTSEKFRNRGENFLTDS